MKSVDSALVHKVLPPRHPSGAPHPAILLLHGRGADEDDLLGLSAFLDERLVIISARAPFPFSYGGYHWYDADDDGTPETQTFRTSYEKLEALVADSLKHYQIDGGRLFLFGFSMGTAMSFALALSRPGLFRGVAANSGYVPEGTSLVYRWRDLSATAFSIAHGTEDPVIPVVLARRARDLFAQSNAEVSYREYPMAHEISQESLDDASAWLRKLIAP